MKLWNRDENDKDQPVQYRNDYWNRQNTTAIYTVAIFCALVIAACAYLLDKV